MNPIAGPMQELPMDKPRKYTPRTRDKDEIAHDIERTQARIDATLDALQERLRPSKLARDAARRLADSSVRGVRNLAQRFVQSESGVRAQRMISEARRTIALLPPGDAAALQATARLAAARLLAGRAKRAQVIKFGVAAVGTVLAAAALRAMYNADVDDDEVPQPVARRPRRRRTSAGRKTKSTANARRTGGAARRRKS